MGQIINSFILVQCLVFFALSFAETNVNQRDRYVKFLTDYLNNLPDQNYLYEDGILANAQQIDENTYFIQINIKQKERENRTNFKHLTCTANVRESTNGEVSVPISNAQCHEGIIQLHESSTTRRVNENKRNTYDQVGTMDAVQHEVKLENEIRPDNVDVIGEHIDVPHVSSTCFGCGSHVDPDAPGVQDLALLAVRHLDKHETSAKHMLINVLEVQRQVQVVNGVRFIITLDIEFDKCSVEHVAGCRYNKICKVSILEKPWVRLPDGSKFRSIISNNCTNEWLFGDNGEVLPTIFETSQEITGHDGGTVKPTGGFQDVRGGETYTYSPTPNSGITNGDSTSDILREVYESDLQAEVRQTTLTDQQIRDLEEQIVPVRETFSYSPHETLTQVSVTERQPLLNSAVNIPAKQHAVEAIPDGTHPCIISDDKKQAIDDLLRYFNFGGNVLPTVYFSPQRNVRFRRGDDKFARVPLSVNIQKNSPISDSFGTKYTENANPSQSVDEVKERKVRSISTLSDPQNEGLNNNMNNFKVVGKNADVDFPEDTYGKQSHFFGSLLGNAHNQNAEKYRQLVMESLNKYHVNSNVQYVHKLVEIVDVTKQIVSGTLTKISFKISPTDCIKNMTNELSQINCKIQDSSNIRNCRSEIYEKSWIKGSKDITVTCGSLQKDRPKNRFSDTKFKRNIAMPGGVQEQNPNENSYMNLALESLAKYQLLSNTPYVHTILRIVRVTTQIVSGILTKLDFEVTPTHCLVNDLFSSDSNSCQIQNPKLVLNCHSEVWDRPWMKQGKQINVTCENWDEINNDRKEKNILGGIEEEDSNNSMYKNIAYQSLQNYESFSNNALFHKITHIKKVTTQIVAGTITRINFTVAPTNCLKSEISASEFRDSECVVLNSNKEYECYVEVWERPWLKDEKEKKQTDIKCDTKNISLRQKRDALVGGQSEKDPNQQTYKDLAQRALQKYQSVSSDQSANKLITVDHVTEQVVAGTLTKINFTISPTSCSKNDFPGQVGKSCEIRNELFKCFAEVWFRSWLQDENDKEQIYVNCAVKESGLSRTKRSSEKNSGSSSDQPIYKNIPGGNKEQDPDDAKYRDMAHESLSQFQSFSNEKYHHIITKVNKVSTQVVQGLITKIDFTVVPTNCLQSDVESLNLDESECELQSSDYTYECHVEVWDRPWLLDDKDKRQREISCVPKENEVQRRKRSLGVVSEANPSDQKYKDMAQRSLQKYQLLSNPQSAHKLITVDRVTLQTVAGSLTRIDFTISPTSCSKSDVSTVPGPDCEVHSETLKCFAKVWLRPWLKDENEKEEIDVNCADNESKLSRSKRSSLAAIIDDNLVNELVQESLRELEITSVESYKLRLIKINNYSTKIDAGRVFTISFDAAYTSCSKYERERDDDTCPYLESLPKRHCVAEIRERLTGNGRKIDVNCENEGTPLLSRLDSGNADVNEIANVALKFIEAKYPHPRKQKIVRIIKWEKQLAADTHYRLKLEVGYTNCSVFSVESNCNIMESMGVNRVCRVHAWIRSHSDHGPKVRVSCNQDADMRELFLQIQAEYLFSEFIFTYKPAYVNDTKETRKRYETFRENLKKIHAFNVYERGTATYGLTRFADLTYEEFKRKQTGLNRSLQNSNEIPRAYARIPDLELPASYDWREQGAVTPVKDQGSCGSCWAFSVTGNIEGQWKLKTGNLLSLSEQELVDCDKLDDGCNGGLPDNAYRAIEQLGGLETEEQYPYEGDDERCAFNKSLSRVTLRGAVNITTNETGIAKWLVQNGPISIGINANAMQFYMGGISHPWRLLCNPNNLDHGVLIVGYGIKDYPLFKKRLPYWIIKNSWGARWGEQGYYRAYRGDGTCGLNLMASSALV